MSRFERDGMRDYYEILDIGRDADADAIKKAYRKLALKHHPDKNGGSKDAEHKFREATEAYEILRDPQRRSAYDRFGHAGVKGGAGGAGGFRGFDFSDALEIFMRDFGGFGFEDLFGGGRRGGARGGPRKGADIRLRLPVTLKEVATGAEKALRVRVTDPCSACAGTGGAEGAEAVPCGTCAGSGEVRRVQRSMLGQLMTVTPCPACGGEGRTVERPCEACGGEGVESGETTVEVQVPAGVSTGDYITLRGRGGQGPRGGVRGDVYVVLEVEEDPRFVRDGADLVFELPVTYTQAVLGARLEVPTVLGSAEIGLPPGTQSGTVFRLRGEGLPRLQASGRGDQLVRVVVWVPAELTAEQEQRLRAVAEVESPAPERVDRGREAAGFWSRVKQAFSA
ncbi:MAG TPA: molecular chaperone DnaJ [Longimicrobiales bacterium]|nr:molecular chaperone DnaJ [Longimicrobiales bacterium]